MNNDIWVVQEGYDYDSSNIIDICTKYETAVSVAKDHIKSCEYEKFKERPSIDLTSCRTWKSGSGWVEITKRKLNNT